MVKKHSYFLMFYACFIEKCDAGYFFGFGQVMKILSHILSLELCLCKLSRISGCHKDETLQLGVGGICILPFIYVHLIVCRFINI